MASIESLKASVEKAAAKVAKCEATIIRHQKALEKKLTAVQKLNASVTLENMVSFKWVDGRGTDLYWPICEVEGKLDDIKGATRKLEDAKEILENWQMKLDLATEKDRMISEEAPAVIVEFLNQWKEKALKWHFRAYDRYIELKKELKEKQIVTMIEAVETFPSIGSSVLLDENGKVKPNCADWFHLVNYCGDRKLLQMYLTEQKIDDKHIDAELANFGPLVQRMVVIQDDNERAQWIEEILEAERKSKILDLVNRVNAVVGSITDASRLRINEKCNLDGIIKGTNAIARVETVEAGGWNVQCFHYRTLVHEVKEGTLAI